MLELSEVLSLPSLGVLVEVDDSAELPVDVESEELAAPEEVSVFVEVPSVDSPLDG